MKSLIQRHPLATFFALSYLFTWLGWVLPERIYTGTTLSFILAGPFFIMLAGPLLASLLVTVIISGKAGVIALLRKFTIWRVGWQWVVVALVLTPAISLVAVYLNGLLGGPIPASIHALIGSLPALLLTFGQRLVFPFDGPMQEELGWRGFALPRLQERYSALVANLILGVMVIIWHLPLVLMGMLPAHSLIATMAFTVVFGWIVNNTKGSVLLVLIAHAADGLFILRNLGMNDADVTRLTWLQVAVWVVVAVVVVLRYGPTLMRKPATPSGITPMITSAPSSNLS